MDSLVSSLIPPLSTEELIGFYRGIEGGVGRQAVHENDEKGGVPAPLSLCHGSAGKGFQKGEGGAWDITRNGKT